MKLTEQELRDHLAQGHTFVQIAEEHGMWPRSVERSADRHGLREMKQPIIVTPAQRDRMLQLASEGMPGTWIAEDVGLSVSTVYRIIGPQPENSHEWKSVWGKIRNRDHLAALHNEFRPRKEVA